MVRRQNSVCDPKGGWGKNLCQQTTRNTQSVLATARNRGMLTIFVNIGWHPSFLELPENQYYPLLQGAKDENKGIVGTWERAGLPSKDTLLHRYRVFFRALNRGNLKLSYQESIMANEFSEGRALVIGVANYPKVSKLPQAVLNDARDLAGVLKAQEYCAYPAANVELLLDADAKADGIRAGLARLAETAGADDTALVFFSGHGGHIENGPDAERI
jgi:Caspase domain